MKITRKEEALLKALRRITRLKEYEKAALSTKYHLTANLDMWQKERDALEIEVKKYISELSGD